MAHRTCIIACTGAWGTAARPTGAAPLPAAASPLGARRLAAPAARRSGRQLAAQPQAATGGGAGSDEAAATATPTPPADVALSVALLRQACRTKRVPAEQVLAAMAAVEAAHVQRDQVQGFPASLAGTWQLVFSAPAPIPAWAYIPVLEFAVIDVEAGLIDLFSEVGPLDCSFKGTCTFEQDPNSGKCAMHFSFSRIEARWFGIWDTKTDIKSPKLKTYTFFLLDGDLSAATSSRGPKTLLLRQPV